MAEGWASQVGERIVQGLRNLNPVTRTRNIGQNFRDHPYQTGISTLLGLVNPALGAVSRIVFDQYNQSQAPDALPGITSPNTYGQPSQNIGNLLGIPNYAGSSSGANQYLTGNFGQQPSNQSPGFQPINMDYGQNPQEYVNADGGLPGITGPNIYSGSPSGSLSGYSGSTASGAQGTFGSGVRQTSMAQIENAIKVGQGQGLNNRVLLPRHEINDELAEAKKLGMTLQQFRNRA